VQTLQRFFEEDGKGLDSQPAKQVFLSSSPSKRFLTWSESAFYFDVLCFACAARVFCLDFCTTALSGTFCSWFDRNWMEALLDRRTELVGSSTQQQTSCMSFGLRALCNLIQCQVAATHTYDSPLMPLRIFHG
jgi:hypothetical protein